MATALKSKIKVGIVFDDTMDSSDGVSQYVKALGPWLSENGCSVRYLVGQTKLKKWHGDKVYSLSKNQKISFNGNRLSIPLPANKEAIQKAVDDEKFDVLHVQMPHSPFMASKVIAAVSNNVGVVGTFHVVPYGPIAAGGSYLLRILYGTGLRRFDEINSVSSAAADFAAKAYGLRTGVIPNAVDVERFKSGATHIDYPVKRIVFLGRLVERKGCRQLIEAFRLLHTRRPDVQLIIAGDGPQREQLESYVEKHFLKDNVTFLGFIDETDKAPLLSSADIACFPSLGGESFGIVLVEAMAAGAGIVLGGDNPGYRTVLGDRPKLLIDPDDTLEFASRLQQLLTNKTMSAKLHEWQIERAKLYDVNMIGMRWLNTYQRVIANRQELLHTDK